MLNQAAAMNPEGDSKSPLAFIQIVPVVLVPFSHIARMHIPNTDIPEKSFSRSNKALNLRRSRLNEDQVRQFAMAKFSPDAMESLKRMKLVHTIVSDDELENGELAFMMSSEDTGRSN